MRLKEKYLKSCDKNSLISDDEISKKRLRPSDQLLEEQTNRIENTFSICSNSTVPEETREICSTISSKSELPTENFESTKFESIEPLPDNLEIAFEPKLTSLTHENTNRKRKRAFTDDDRKEVFNLYYIIQTNSMPSHY